MDKTKVVMCSVRDRGYSPIVGSVTWSCEKCGAGVWIAPTGIAMVEAGDTMVYCIHCGLKSVEETDGDIMPPTPEQLEELRKQEAVDRARENN